MMIIIIIIMMVASQQWKTNRKSQNKSTVFSPREGAPDYKVHPHWLVYFLGFSTVVMHF